jgi:hypothetical protein
MQTLIVLDLSSQEINDKGVEHLVNELKTNKVILLPFFSRSFLFIFSLLQTLKVLNLSCNEIGPKGAQFIADVLRINKVT